MKVQFNTDHTIDGNEKLEAHVASVVNDALARHAEHVTRVEVHVSEQSHEGRQDVRCMMEARIEGRQPIAVTEQSASIHQAVAGGSKKLERVVAGALRSRSAHR